jgi:hypothetical protein
MKLPLRRIALLSLLALISFSTPRVARAYPKPSPYPVSWEMKCEYAQPKRILANTPQGEQAYWYMTFELTNNSDKEQLFLPVFQLLRQDGTTTRSERVFPPGLIDAIRGRERKRDLETLTELTGQIKVGDDAARRGVAVWKETPGERLGRFSVLITGLSGESVILTDKDNKPIKGEGGKPIVLWKTLKLDYHLPGTNPDAMTQTGQEWVMAVPEESPTKSDKAPATQPATIPAK